MIKIITSTWAHAPSYNIEHTILYRSVAKYNNPNIIENFHWDRGCNHDKENEYGSRLGKQAEYILYKVDLLRDKVHALETDYIIFCDANDVTCTGPVDSIVNYFDLDKKIIFSAERNDWPKADMRSVWENYPDYKPWDRENRMFLNSGVMLAKKEKFVELLNACMTNFVEKNIQGHGGDQGVFTHHYNTCNDPEINLDYANILALSTYDSNVNDYYLHNNRIWSKKFGTAPLFVHDSGTNYGGQMFARKFGL